MLIHRFQIPVFLMQVFPPDVKWGKKWVESGVPVWHYTNSDPGESCLVVFVVSGIP